MSDVESVGDKDGDEGHGEYYAAKDRPELLQVGIQYFFERELIPIVEVGLVSLAEWLVPLGIGSHYWLFLFLFLTRVFMNTDSEWDKILAGENDVATRALIREISQNSDVYTQEEGEENNRSNHSGDNLPRTHMSAGLFDEGGAHHIHCIIDKLDVESPRENQVGWV